MVHLQSWRDGELKPVISGTSLAGVLRHRAERIANTLSVGNRTKCLINNLFGDVDEETKAARSSRLIIHEAVITDSHDMVQNRIAIDRFTGGAYHGALFDEQPVWGNGKTEIHLALEIRSPEKHEIGLLLLLLKDLWTEDLPVGGESSIGRGRLKGQYAEIEKITRGEKLDKHWKISQNNGLKIEDLQNPKKSESDTKEELEEYVKSMIEYF